MLLLCYLESSGFPLCKVGLLRLLHKLQTKAMQAQIMKREEEEDEAAATASLMHI